MNNKIKIYYIPNNPNIKKGTIYTLYINNNTNLDLSSLLENKIILEEYNYKRLIEITNLLTSLLTDLNKLNIEYQNILKKFSIERKN